MYTLQRDVSNEQLRKLPSKGMWCVWGGTVVVRCPSCSTVSNCHNHRVLVEGQMAPSFVCGNKQCDFHEFVKLADFESAITGNTEQGERPLTRCSAGRDGECNHPKCPQLRDGEPAKSGRHCPIDIDPEEA